MKVGVILMDHGEPPVYGKHTYSSFRDFATCLIEMGFIPSIVLRFDKGTIARAHEKKIIGCFILLI